MNCKRPLQLRTQFQSLLFVAILGLCLFLGTQPAQASPAVVETAPSTPQTVISLGQTPPPNLYDAIAIAAGYEHSIALKRDGTVVSWGKTPATPAGLTNVVAIAAGRYGSLALRSDGTLVAWGSANFGQLDVPAGLTGVVDMAMGDTHSVAVKQDGTVVVWGRSLSPKMNPPAGLSDVVAVSASMNYNLALKRDGTVVAWGPGMGGWLNVPASLNNVVDVVASPSVALALKSDGTVVAWGGTDPMNPPAGLTDVMAIDADQYHAVALKRDGTLVKWGYLYLLNVPDYLKQGVTAVALGFEQTLALVNDTIAPETTLGARPAQLGLNPSIFDFSGTDNLPSVLISPMLSFECSLDGAPFATCTAPIRYEALSPGTHSFVVRAKDGAGNVDSTPESYTWTIADCADGYDVVNESSLAMGLACFKQRTTPGAYTLRLINDIATSTTQTAENTKGDVYLVLDGQNHTWDGQRQISAGFDVKPGTTVTIQNLTVRNFGAHIMLGGNAIYNRGALTIRNSIITDNRGTYGAGVTSQGGTLTIENSTFTGNSTSGSGSSLALQNTIVTIQHSSFTNNRALEWAGGIFVNYGTMLTLTDVTFSSNSASSNPDIYNYQGYGTIVINPSTTLLTDQSDVDSVAENAQNQQIFLPIVNK